MRPPKIVIHGSVIFVTASIEQGILLPPNSVFNHILECILARAQELYPVCICALCVEGSHVHMVLTVKDPNDVKDFMRYFKTESAHAINIFLGRRKRTVWCAGNDGPVLLTEEAVVKELVYLYTNPAKDALVSSIEHYPGVSSWKMFTKNRYTIERRWLRRPVIKKIAHRLRIPKKRETDYTCNFTIEPNAWMDCFHIEEDRRARINETIRSRIEEAQKRFQRERQAEGKGVIGKDKLIREWFKPEYVPERTGRRMLCISTDIPLRIRFITWAKVLIAQARRVYRLWLAGDFSVAYPLGLYPPSLPRKAELLSLSSVTAG